LCHSNPSYPKGRLTAQGEKSYVIGDWPVLRREMTASSPCNPNACVSCEQLLEDDGMELDSLLAGVARLERGKRPIDHPGEDSTREPHETFSSSV